MARHLQHRAEDRGQREEAADGQGVPREGREGAARDLQRRAEPAGQVPHRQGDGRREPGVLPEDEGRLLPLPGRGGHRRCPQL